MNDKIKLVNDLIKFADKLDRKGDVNSVDLMDKVILVLAQEIDEGFDLEIPQDEKDILDNVLKSLKESLQ